MPSEVLRGRVGAPPPPQLGGGGVLRSRVGDDDSPRVFAKRLRDELQDETPDEAIDQADEQLAAQGLDPQARIQKYAEQGKREAVKSYVTTKEPTKAQRVFALIGDIAGGLRGGSYTSQQEGLRAKYDSENAAAQKTADEDADVEARAAQIEAIFKQSGRSIPPTEGSDPRRRARAIVNVFGPAVGSLLKPQGEQGEDLGTFEAKEQIKAKYRPEPQGRQPFDEGTYRRKKEIDAEYSPALGGGRYDPNRPLSPSEQLSKTKYEEELKTPYGKAQDADSAKKLRTSYEQSNNLQRALGTMKRIRETVGTEVLEREDVAEGQQAAAEAKLALKELAKLGVLSSTDYTFLDQLLPADPTSFDFVPFSDPIMAKIEKAIESANAREEVGRKTYLAQGEGAAPSAPPPAPAASPAQAGGGGTVRVRSPSGKLGSIPRSSLEAARAKGFTEVE